MYSTYASLWWNWKINRKFFTFWYASLAKRSLSIFIFKIRYETSILENPWTLVSLKISKTFTKSVDQFFLCCYWQNDCRVSFWDKENDGKIFSIIFSSWNLSQFIILLKDFVILFRTLLVILYLFTLINL